MNAKLKLSGILLGAALSSTGALAANGSCGAGKCGGEAKKVEKKASCGAGKCGGNMKDEAKTEMEMKSKKMASCGAGKCGGEAKKETKKATGACGAGKCG